MKPSKSTRARASAVALVAVAATAVISGCSATSPFQTTETMSLGDGVPVDVGDLEVRNLALVSGEDGGQAVLTGTVGNTGTEDATFQAVVGEGETLEAKVPAGGVVVLSGEGDQLSVPALDASPGDMVEIAVGTGASDQTPVSVPVLDAQGYYEDYAPSSTSSSSTSSSPSSS